MLLLLRLLYERQSTPSVTFTGNGSVSFSARFTGAGAETFTGSATFTASATFSGVGVLSTPVSGTGTFNTSATFAGAGTLSGDQPSGGGGTAVPQAFLDLEPAIALALAETDEEFASLMGLTVQIR